MIAVLKDNGVKSTLVRHKNIMCFFSTKKDTSTQM
jgi:hypothetical protein